MNSHTKTTAALARRDSNPAPVWPKCGQRECVACATGQECEVARDPVSVASDALHEAVLGVARTALENEDSLRLLARSSFLSADDREGIQNILDALKRWAAASQVSVDAIIAESRARQ